MLWFYKWETVVEQPLQAPWQCSSLFVVSCTTEGNTLYNTVCAYNIKMVIIQRYKHLCHCLKTLHEISLWNYPLLCDPPPAGEVVTSTMNPLYSAALLIWGTSGHSTLHKNRNLKLVSRVNASPLNTPIVSSCSDKSAVQYDKLND